MLFTLPDLPYPFDALEPHIDARTMELHHDKHHGTYVSNLNKALEGHDIGHMTIEELMASIDTLPEQIRTMVRNNGGDTPTIPCSGPFCPGTAGGNRRGIWPRRWSNSWAASIASSTRLPRRP